MSEYKPSNTSSLLEHSLANTRTSSFHFQCTAVVYGTDIWTTRCTRCPAALDKLNEMAATTNQDGHHNKKTLSIQYVSICCDKLDGAREILERDSTPRWSHVRHFFMDNDHKEHAKELLGFQQVPYYIVFDDAGTMVFSGNKLPDINDLLQRTKEPTTSANSSTPQPATKTTSEASSPIDVTALDFDGLDF